MCYFRGVEIFCQAVLTIYFSMLNFQPNWPALLDKLKLRLDLNETELAATIGLSRSMLSQVRIDHRPLPTKAKLVVLDRLGYVLTRGMVLSALPTELSATISEADNARAQEKAMVAVCRMFLEEDFDRLDPPARKRFVSQLCVVGECDRKVLAKALEIRPSDLRAIESAESKLPFWAKTALLDNFDAAELNSAIEKALDPDPSPSD